MTDVEQRVALMWTEILQRSAEVSPEDNFFEAGGDSLAMMMLLFQVKEDMGVELSPAALIEAPTLRQFCRAIEAGRRPPDSVHVLEPAEAGGGGGEPI